MPNFFLQVLDKFGMGAVQIAIICFFAWKLAYNHLKHIQIKLDEISEQIKCFETDLSKTKERISNVEGQLEVRILK